MSRAWSWFASLSIASVACSAPTITGESEGGGSGATTGPSDGESEEGSAGSSDDEQDGASEAGDDGDPGARGCCEAHPSAGCDETTVEACVCEMDAVCCTFEWDDNCVDTARNRCEATCTPDAVDDSGGDDGVDGMDGMADTGPAATSDTDDGGDGMDGGGSDACCMPVRQPGCSDGALEDCVCAADPYCCQMAWDFMCVMAANQACGADCNPGGGSTACCDLHMMPGCDDMMVENCVCDLDPFCCNQAWDEQCVDEADQQCNADCGG